MATKAATAPSTRFRPLQTAAHAARDAIERWLEAERDQLFLWLPVAIGAGVTAWFVLPDPRLWTAAILAMLGIAATGTALGMGGRAGRSITIGALAVVIGLSLVWWRAEHVRAPVLERPTIVRFEARVEQVDALPARDLVRLRLAPTRWIDGTPDPAPTRLRVNLAAADAPAGLSEGAVIRLRSRLMPPPSAAVPGAYDFARVAWFDGVGATGRGFAPVEIITGGDLREGLRARLSRHIHSKLEGSAGGIAAALATGDTGAISDEDAEAMRRSGLAHLLSVSGLHITAAVALTMLLASRLLALSPWLALTGRVPLIAAGAAAMVAVGYTLLTGNQVPTIRSCVAALLVLIAMAIGREAVTLRLVAAGAVVVLLLWPESLAGPSFQLSFAAVTAIIALHEHPRIRAFFMARDDGWIRGAGRNLASLLMTGLAVELALMPIAVFHFHKAGIYGAIANIVAIPLTTFVVMPLEAAALLLDAVGLGGPLWWLTGRSLALLLLIARTVAAAPGSVAALPAMPGEAYGLMVAGGLWLALWRTVWRRLGMVPLIVGAVWAAMTPAPDLLVTGDGRHVALRMGSGAVAMLRDRAGDYTRAMLSENGGMDGDPLLLAEQSEARCSRDLCMATRDASGRQWRIVATRSAYLVPITEMVAACRTADIVISERRLPRTCTPRWLKLDRLTLEKTGGVAITLADGQITTVRQAGDRHPWALAAVGSGGINHSGAADRKAFPARSPARRGTAASHKPGLPGRAESWPPHDGSI